MGAQEFVVRTWLDDVASRVGFGTLAAKLPIRIAPSTLAVVCGLFIDTVVLQGYKEFTGGTATVFRNPFWLAIPVVIFSAVYITRDLTRRYHDALSELHIDSRVTDSDRFYYLVDRRIRWALFVLSATVIVANLVFFVTIPVIIETDGIAGVIGNFIIVPLVYVPVVTDFIATYLGIQVILPRRLARSDFELDFLDPERLGGLRPLGELVKHSYYYTVSGIIALALFIYGPGIFGNLLSAPVEPSPIVDGLFTVAWLVGAFVVGYAIFVFHRLMRNQKREKLRKLNTQYRDLIEQPWDISNHRIPDSKSQQIEDLERRMDRVTSTREYPATFAMWTQLLIGIVLPKGVQLLLTSNL